MHPGFEVSLGTNFVAEIGPCGAISSKSAPDDGGKDASKSSRQKRKQEKKHLRKR